MLSTDSAMSARTQQPLRHRGIQHGMKIETSGS